MATVTFDIGIATNPAYFTEDGFNPALLTVYVPGTSVLSYTPSSLPDGTYYFGVRQHQGGGTSGWAVRQIIVLQLPDMPTLVSPADDVWLDESEFVLADMTTGLGGSATASDSFSGYAPSLAFNDSLAGNWWASANASPPHWLAIDLGSPTYISRWNIYTTETPTQQYKLQYYNGSIWVDASGVVTPTDNTWEVYDLSTAIEAQNWRFYSPGSSNGWAGIYEAELMHADGMLLWSPAARATSYLVEIALASDPTFSAPVESEEVTTNFYLPTLLSSANDYIWRVTARNGSGDSSPSTARDLHVQNLPDIITLLTPTNGRSVSKTLLGTGVTAPSSFTWTADPLADTYDFQYSGDNTFATQIIDATGIATPNFAPVWSGGEPVEGTRYFRVRGENETGKGEWSAVFSVDVSPTVWDWLASLSGYRVAWWGRDSDSLLMRATNPYFSYGRNSVLTSDFSVDANWTKGAGWVIAAGVATSAGAGTLSQPLVMTINKWYEVTFDVVGFVSGSMGLGGFSAGGSYTANGTYTVVRQASNTTLSFTSASFVGSIDNVSVRQVNIRASTDFPVVTGRLTIAVNGGMTHQGYGWSGTNWVHDSVNNKYAHTPGAVAILTQASAPTVIGKSYDVTFSVSDRTAGQVTARVGTGAGTARTTNSTWTESIVCVGSQSLNFLPDSAFDGKVYAVSCVPTDGLLIMNGDGASTTGWVAGNSGTISATGGRLRVARNGVNNPSLLQPALVVGRKYRFTGIAYGDGTAVPAVGDASSVVFVGTSSTSAQPFDFIRIAADARVLLQAQITSGTNFCEFDDVKVIEINPLDATISGSTLNNSAPVAFDSDSLVFDGVNDAVNPYSVEFNSLIPATQNLTVIVFPKYTGSWTDGAARRMFFNGLSGTERYWDLFKSSANNVLAVNTIGGGVSVTVQYTGQTVGANWFMIGAQIDLAGNSQMIDINGSDAAAAGTGLAQVAGNLGTTSAAIGASNPTGSSPWTGEIAAAIVFDGVLSDAQLLKAAQLGETI